MNEEQKVQQYDDMDVITALKDFPYFVLNREIKTGYSLYQDELINIKKNYVAYENGAKFVTEGTAGDYIASHVKYKKASMLINKEARYMFSQTPDITVTSVNNSEEHKEQLQTYQTLIDKVLSKSKFSKILLQSAKDCFIGKRVACLVDFSETKGALVHFYNSLQFYYETEYGSDDLTKFVTFENVTESKSTAERMFLVNKYELINGVVYMQSDLFNGSGKPVQTLVARTRTDLSQIPAVVIFNDGTLQQKRGVSDIQELLECESAYSFLSNADVDALRKGMNPIRYAVDMNSDTTEGLSSGAGAFWDLKTDQNMNMVHPMVGTLAPALNHTETLKATLNRLNETMHNQVDVPNISEETLVGTITSGKALKALYYPLTVRCNEKMTTWIPDLEKIVEIIIEFMLLNKSLVKEIYGVPDLQAVQFTVNIKPNYALLEDEDEEIRIDLEKIAMNAMSRKTFMKKWGRDAYKTDEQIDEELMQIAVELNMFDTMSMNTQVQDKMNDLETDKGIEKDLEGLEIEQKIGE